MVRSHRTSYFLILDIFREGFSGLTYYLLSIHIDLLLSLVNVTRTNIQSPWWFGGTGKRKVFLPKVFLTIKIFSAGSNLLSTADLWFGLLLLPQSQSAKKLCHHQTKNISCLQRTLLQFRFPLKTFAIPTLRRLLCILNLSIFLGKVACNIKLSLAWMDHHENKKWLLQFQIPGSGVSISGTISLSRSAACQDCNKNTFPKPICRSSIVPDNLYWWISTRTDPSRDKQQLPWHDNEILLIFGCDSIS